jgi:hypothetical protein
MSNANVVVLTSTEHTSTMAFDSTASMVSLIALFVDMHDRWDVHFEMVLVHKNNRVLRYRGNKLQELVEVGYGLQMAGFLANPTGSVPTMNYVDWLDKDLITKVFDSRLDGADFDDENEPC